MKYLSILLMTSILFAGQKYSGSTTAAVVVAGGIVKAKHIETNKKYKRKDCPVCKGKGWYMSGDNITKVDCGYCEPEKGQSTTSAEKNVNCKDGGCNPINSHPLKNGK